MSKPLDCLYQVKQILTSLENGDNQAMWLCCHILNLDTAHMLLNDDEISMDVRINLIDMANRVAAGYPIQYAIGNTQFMGLNFACCENVLIPRNDTEVLTELAIKHIGTQPMSVVDLCCGTGCIGLSIKYYCANSKVTLLDISPHALKLAKENATNLGVTANIVQADMFSNLSGAFDVIVSNPPYIPSKVIPTLSTQVRHEPLLALDGSEDGLKYYRIIAKEYRRFLKPGGLMLMEIGYDQGRQLLSLFGTGEVLKDLQSRDRILKLEK